MSSFPKYLKNIKGVHFAITGRCWLVRNVLIGLIEKKGGKVSDHRAQVTNLTEVLIRGSSSQWAFDNCGHKEVKVANLLKTGKIILTVHDYDFQNLIESGKAAKALNRIAGQPIEWLLPALEKEKYFKISKVPGTLDREHSVKGRLEQKFLREQLFGNKSFFKCGICGKILPLGIMVAGHIKPRSECTINEKKDFINIVFSVCLLGCDALYERGYIGINDSGFIEVPQKPKVTKALKSVLNKLENKRCLSWNDKNSMYFAWHYGRRFEH
ncbi:MAG: hypothetical protein WC879_04435 [Melioribacteraceae bacterium]